MVMILENIKSSSLFMDVLEQESFNRGGRLQKKWLMILGLQKDNFINLIVCVNDVIVFFKYDFNISRIYINFVIIIVQVSGFIMVI